MDMGSNYGLSPEDKRINNISNDFNAVINNLVELFKNITNLKRGRVFHKLATTCKGYLVMIDKPSIPAHSFFVAGKRYPVLIRYANGVQEDDAAVDNRGATLRILDANEPENYQKSELDLLLSTGQCFLTKNANDFFKWSYFNEDEKKAFVIQNPQVGQAAWEMYRAINSYDSVHYYSKTANQFIALNGDRYFVRFRLLPLNKSDDTGFIEPNGNLMPPEYISRQADDQRAKDFLHQDLRAKISANGIDGLLQIQLRKLAQNESENEEALDCTQKWQEDKFPWQDIAKIHLNDIIAGEKIDLLSFNPINAPADLAIPLAYSPAENASLVHLRSIVYELTARARGYKSAQNKSIETEDKKKNAKICVIGAGPSGLATAYELTKRGYQVTVLEKDKQIGGKAQAINIAGINYDLGAHVCTQHYQATAKLVKAFNVEIEPDNPSLIFDIDNKKVNNFSANGTTLVENVWRYRKQRHEKFNGITQPGYYQAAATEFSQPIQAWLESHNYAALGQALMIPYTASGYGYLNDPDLAILYLLKFAEQGSLAETSTDLPVSWTLKNGFIELWQRIADSLPDVRCGTEVQFVERHDNQVVVHLANEKLVFDQIVLACPLEASLAFLDATAEEKELFNKIEYVDYYTTVCSIENLPKNGFYLIKQHCEQASSSGHVVAFHHRYASSNIYCCYSYGNPTLDGDDIKKLLQEDVERMDGKINEFHTQRRWTYFPHVNSQEVKAGYFSKLEGLQGKNNTYYVGSIFNFELIETNLMYVNNLVERYFHVSQQVVNNDAAIKEGRSIDFDSLDTSEYLKELLAKHLNINLKTLNSDTEILALGLDSIKAIEIFRQLGEKFKVNLDPTLFFDYPTIKELADYLEQGVVVETVDDILSEEMEVSKQSLSFNNNVEAVQYLKELFAKKINLSTEVISSDTEMLTLGLDSIAAVEIFQQLEDRFSISLDPNVFFDYPTIGMLANYLMQETSVRIKDEINSIMHDPLIAKMAQHTSAINVALDKDEVSPIFTQFKNFVYAERNGIGLVMDIFVPKTNNKKLGVIDVVSALGNSERHVINNHAETGLYEELCSKGFTVFALRPGSRQIFNLEDMLIHVKRGIRFIKSRAEEFHINENCLTLTGGSFGAYLSLQALLVPQAEAEDMDFLQGKYNSQVQAMLGFSPVFDFNEYTIHADAIAKNMTDANRHMFYLRFYESLWPTKLQTTHSKEDISQWLKTCDLTNQIFGPTPPMRIYQVKQDSLVMPIKAEKFVHAINIAGGKAELKLIDSDQHNAWETIRDDINYATYWLLDLFNRQHKNSDESSTKKTLEYV